MIFLSFFPVIENLPVEMRERLTEMRETDLQVQSKFFDIFKIACVLSCPLIAEQFCFSLLDIISLGESSFVAKGYFPCVVYPTELFAGMYSVYRVYFYSPRRRSDFLNFIFSIF